MKKMLSVICFLGVGCLYAELEMIDVIEPSAVEQPSDVAAPTAGDHSQAPDTGPQMDQVFFLNGDRLSGVLEKMDVETGLVWKHPDAVSETVYKLDNLKEIKFKNGEAQADALSQLPRIELTNGDQYRGRILSMDAEHLMIDTPLGGNLQIRSGMVVAIRPVVDSGGIYSGPNSIDEWQLNNNGDSNWEFKNNALYSTNHNQVAGMELKDLPDKISFDFTMEWKGNMNLQLGFWGQDPKNVNQNCYTLAIQNNYLRCYRYYNNIGRSDLGNTQIRDEMNDGKIDVRLLLNRQSKEVLVIFDGNLVARWTDTFDGKIVGDAIIFGGMGNNPIKISRISVREWDGEFKLDPSVKPKEQDQLTTTNGDIFAGNLEKIEDELLYFKNDFAVFQVPLERVSEISFSQATRAEPRLQAGDVEIFFANKERITLKLLKLDQREFQGMSEATGEVVFQKSYFVEMKMNPYDDRHNIEEDGW